MRSNASTPNKSLRRLLGSAVLSVIALPVITSALPSPAQAQSNTLNLYSARHYQSDDLLYAEFTKQTGIKVNQIQAGDEALLERLRSEGKASPADVILLVDAARLWKAQTEGLFQPAKSSALTKALPANMQADDLWFGFTTRARLIVYDKTKVKPGQITSYDDLAKPEFKGMVCARSGSHPYMLSLLASIVEHQGEAKAEAWAKGVVANLARTPRGGDTDQIRGVMSGECAVALTNSYYLVRLLKSNKPDEKAAAQALGVVWPNQAGTGTHINVSGGGIARYAQNPDNARRFLEFLASPQAQAHLANANNEWPAVPGVRVDNPELEGLGKFKADTISIGAIGKSQPTAARIIDRAGWR
jgi:iron(III) transport system substrate-binding protein